MDVSRFVDSTLQVGCFTAVVALPLCDDVCVDLAVYETVQGGGHVQTSKEFF